MNESVFIGACPALAIYTRVHLDAAPGSLFPSKRGEGWGEGIGAENHGTYLPGPLPLLGGDGENGGPVKMRPPHAGWHG